MRFKYSFENILVFKLLSVRFLKIIGHKSIYRKKNPFFGEDYSLLTVWFSLSTIIFQQNGVIVKKE